MTLSRSLFLLALATACGGSIPQTGVWEYTDEDVTQNTCGDAITYDGTSGEFTIVDHGDDTFTVDPLDGTPVFQCTLDGKDYDCPERLSETIDLGYGAEAEISVAVSGAFANQGEATGTQTATLVCVNSACETAAAAVGIPSPCTIEVDFEAEWVDDLDE